MCCTLQNFIARPGGVGAVTAGCVPDKGLGTAS